jgi:SAM-dependent methyltransferase
MRRFLSRLIAAPRACLQLLRRLRAAPDIKRRVLAMTKMGRVRDCQAGSFEGRFAKMHDDLKKEMAAQLSFSLHDFIQIQREIKEELDHVRGQLDRTERRQEEINNTVLHINTSVHTRLNTFEFEVFDSLHDQLHELTASLYELHAKARANDQQRVLNSSERYEPAKPELFDAYLARAEREFPNAYPHWKVRLDEMLQAFRISKVGNAANPGDPRSRLFRSLVRTHATGRVLDAGCGVFGRPYYLMDYPAELISGLDPLMPVNAPDFEFARGITEYLPWPDASFSTVISATSLDHCLSLDRSLAEIHRVLRPGGRLLLWIDSLAGTPKFDPDSPTFKPIDQFHLFHFDAAWFDPMLQQKFDTEERLELRRREFGRVMYSLIKRG